MRKEKGQVSIETLLLAAIIIMMAVSVLGYYTRIMPSTIALETIRIETLKQIDNEEVKYILKNPNNDDVIQYTITGNEVDFCIFTEPAGNFLDTEAIKIKVEKNTIFEMANMTVCQNSGCPCP